MFIKQYLKYLWALLTGGSVVGLQIAYASSLLNRRNIPFRFGSIDGKPQIVTQDYKPLRANLHTVNGVITKVTWG